jgi:hypothetical protein
VYPPDAVHDEGVAGLASLDLFVRGQSPGDAQETGRPDIIQECGNQGAEGPGAQRVSDVRYGPQKVGHILCFQVPHHLHP